MAGFDIRSAWWSSDGDSKVSAAAARWRPTWTQWAGVSVNPDGSQECSTIFPPKSHGNQFIPHTLRKPSEWGKICVRFSHSCLLYWIEFYRSAQADETLSRQRKTYLFFSGCFSSHHRFCLDTCAMYRCSTRSGLFFSLNILWLFIITKKKQQEKQRRSLDTTRMIGKATSEKMLKSPRLFRGSFGMEEGNLPKNNTQHRAKLKWRRNQVFISGFSYILFDHHTSSSGQARPVKSVCMGSAGPSLALPKISLCKTVVFRFSPFSPRRPSHTYISSLFQRQTPHTIVTSFPNVSEKQKEKKNESSAEIIPRMEFEFETITIRSNWQQGFTAAAAVFIHLCHPSSARRSFSFVQ